MCYFFQNILVSLTHTKLIKIDHALGHDIKIYGKKFSFGLLKKTCIITKGNIVTSKTSSELG